MKTLGQAGKHGALSDSEQWFYGLGGRSDGSKKNEVAPSWDVHQKVSFFIESKRFEMNPTHEQLRSLNLVCCTMTNVKTI